MTERDKLIKALNGDVDASVELLQNLFCDTYEVMKLAKMDIDTNGMTITKQTKNGLEYVKNPATDVYLNSSKVFSKILYEQTPANLKSVDDDENEKISLEEKKKQQLKTMYAQLKKMEDSFNNKPNETK